MSRWWRRSRRMYAVDGVVPRRSSDGWDVYDGDILAGRPVVAEAAGRLPQEPASRPGTDIYEQALAAAPWTESVERVDREAFVFTTAGVLTADVVLAHCLDVCGEVYRRLGGPPPELRTSSN